MDRDSPVIDYRAFLESTPLVPWELDGATGHLTYVGPQALALLGHPTSEWLTPSFWRDRILPDDQAAVAEARDRLMIVGGSHVIEYRMEHAAGHLVWVSEAASAVQDAGDIRGLRGLLSDVTGRKRLEVSLAQSEERLRTLIRNAPDAMIFTEVDGTILNMNDQARYLFDYGLEEIGGSSIDLLVPERLRDRLVEQRSAFDQDRARQTLVDGQSFAIQRRDGEEVPVELSISLVPISGGRQLLYAVRDLTPRLRAEAQLRATEGRLRGMAEAMPALVSFIDSSQRYRFVNEAYADWVGWERSAMEGRPVREVLGEDVYARLRPSIEAALSGVAVHFKGEADVAGANVADRTVDVTYVPHREGETITGYFVVVIEAGQGGRRDRRRSRRWGMT